MAYLVLARKHRPKTFSEMVGQEHVVQALENALTSQRLHHAYLFTGTRGVGKTTVSRILAKSLNCQGPDGQGGITATPCGVCQACKDIDSGRFVDYTELDAASNRGVDEVQALLEQAVYKPVQGRFKVFMIDEVHMLTGHAFNAMLKTLEEPPEYLKFVLATTDPQKVPVTVLSRCLQFNLRPMAPETVLEHLTQVLQTEAVPAEPHALRLIARAARGSMRDALSLTDQAIAFGNGELLEAGVRQMLGSVDRGHVFHLIEALAQGDGKTVVETSEALRRDGFSAASMLEEMTAVLQGMAVLQAVPSRAETDNATDPDAAETARLAALMPADETQLLYSLCLHGRGELGLAPDEYAALTMVLLRLLAFKPADTASAEKKTLNEAPRAVVPAPTAGAVSAEAVDAVRQRSDAPSPAATPASSEPAPARTTAPAASTAPPGQRLPVLNAPALAASAPPRPAADAGPAAAKVMAMQVRVQPPPGAREAPRESMPGAVSAPIVPTEEGDFWHAIVTRMVAAEAVTALARELALQSQLVARDVDQWLLRVERESLNQTASREKLQAALAALGHEIRIAIEIGSVADSPARRNRQAAEERQRVAEEAIRSDPEVQSMMRDWDAKIVPGTLRPA
ncbi:DNA polymerase III subunit tau [Variovorax sp. SRS16]|uniref:DNA polymerase III subunit gamma/tau n=1 Tax=Variovorax sp. SRS16 TaxID=282217 RepID=UPI001315E941|nr:DNA polymerase III subunit gamma/tau [Variovorax sp. SRS16]VTU21882.1 DNA polymerase III subunit tau [Variovorax sp. SRS16]